VDEDPFLICVACGRPLLDVPEDDPVGTSGQPQCGECARERNFAAVEELFLFGPDDEHPDPDNELDGEL
jgi:hypothetical protein